VQDFANISAICLRTFLPSKTKTQLQCLGTAVRVLCFGLVFSQRFWSWCFEVTHGFAFFGFLTAAKLCVRRRRRISNYQNTVSLKISNFQEKQKMDQKPKHSNSLNTVMHNTLHLDLARQI